MERRECPMTRRRFIELLAAGAALTAAAPWAGAEARVVAKKAIPSTGELLPVIGMGTARTFDVGADARAREELVPVLQALFDNGGTVIDSSPMYGSAEEVVGYLLRKVHHEQAPFVATKVWTFGKESGIRQMLDSMQRLGVEVIDLMQIHNLRDWRVHVETLKEWKAAGKVRYIGITTSHGRMHQELEQAMKEQPFDFVQLSYNIEDRAVEERLLPLAAERRMGVLVNRPFQTGGLFRRTKGKPLPDWAKEFGCASWAQFFLKFAVSHPAATCAIPATADVRHMIDDMGANYEPLPDAALRERMVRYYQSL
jgi:diketogulonate reductase-like aldo/keto reductase